MSSVAFPTRCFFLGLISIACIGGCSSNDYAEAIIRIRRDRVPGSDQQFKNYMNTQGQLLASTYVINRALQSENTPKNLTLKQVESELEVDCETETELIIIRLATGNRTAKETERILDEVIRAYRTEIVSKERLVQVEALANLRKRYQDTYDQLVKETGQVNALADRLGAIADEHGNRYIKTAFDLKKQHQLYLQQRLVELQLEHLETNDSNDGESPPTNAKIEFVKELIDENKTKLRAFGGTSGELQARTLVLRALREELSRIQEAKLELELELEKPAVATVIQEAYVKVE